jgi:hypothetical protein
MQYPPLPPSRIKSFRISQTVALNLKFDQLVKVSPVGLALFVRRRPPLSTAATQQSRNLKRMCTWGCLGTPVVRAMKVHLEGTSSRIDAITIVSNEPGTYQAGTTSTWARRTTMRTCELGVTALASRDE